MHGVVDQVTLDNYLLSQPKIIHQVWFGTIPNKHSARKAYEKLELYRKSWPEKNPGWVVHEWSKAQSLQLVKTHYPEHLDMYKRFKYEIQRCDAVRYFILHRYGGIYADMDYYCNRSFDDVLALYKNPIYLVQTPNRVGKYVSNSLMYSVKGNVFWKKVFLEMENRRNKYDLYLSKHVIVMCTTGPSILNHVFQRYRMRYPVGIYPSDNFHPHGITTEFKTLSLPDSVYAVHIGKGSWEGGDSKLLLFLLREWKLVVSLIATMYIPIFYV